MKDDLSRPLEQVPARKAGSAALGQGDGLPGHSLCPEQGPGQESAFFEALPHPLVLADLGGTVLRANRAFLATFRHRSEEDLVGRPLEAAFPSAAGLLREVLDGGRYDALTRVRRGDGSEADARVGARVLYGADERPEMITILPVEATACRRYQYAVQAGARAEEGDGPLLDRLVASLASALDFPVVFIGEAQGETPSRVSVVAIHVDGATGEPFGYDLAGTPCENVVGRRACLYSTGVEDLFPLDTMLREMGITGYVGVPLEDSRGRPLGLVAALSRHPIAHGESAKDVLELFASRAAGEIERRRAEEARTQTEEESRRIVRSIPVGLHRYRLEASGELVLAGANPAADSILGLDHSRLLGRTIEEAFPGLDATQIPDTYRRIAEGGAPWRRDEVLYDHGSIRGAYVVEAFQTAPSEMAAAFLDVTDRLRRQRERSFLADISHAALGTQGLGALLDELAGAVARHLGADGTVVALWDADHGRITATAGYGTLSGVGAPGEAALGDTVAGLLDARPDPPAPGAKGGTAGVPATLVSRPGALAAPLAAWALLDGEQPIGAVLASFATPVAGEALELSLANEARSQLALALAKARLLERNRERLAALLALHQTGVDLSSRLELSALLRSIVERAQALVGAAMAGFYRAEPDGSLELLIANGTLEPFVGVRLPPGQGAAGAAASSRRPVLVGDYQRWSGRAAVFGGVPIGSAICVPVLWRGDVLGSLYVNHPDADRFGTPDLETVTLFAEQAAVAIANARLIGDLQRANDDLARSYDATLEGWVRALDLRDKETEGHTQRVTEQTVALARRLGVPEADLVHVRRGALLHDIGKIGVPDRILRKPGPLTEAEWELMRRHPEYARDMLAPIPYLRPALAIPYCHHERWDGKGYPRGLAGEEIPFAARLFAVVDVWDALRFDRPYRPGLSTREVRAHLESIAASHLDPAVVEAFLATDPA